MKKLLTILVIAAFTVSYASAHCGKCEGDKGKSEHKCSDACKDKCAKKDADKKSDKK
jgi:hypothetical protein